MLQPLQPGGYTLILAGDAMTAVPRVPQHAPRYHPREFKFPSDEFIEAVRPHKFLYDHNEPDFKNTAMKETLWDVIGGQFGISGGKAMNKWRNMRDTYFKVHKQKQVDRRLKVTPQTGRPVKVWPLYYKMRQIFGVKQPTAANASAASGSTGSKQPSSDSAPPNPQGAATSQKDMVTVTRATTNGAELHDPELSSNNAGVTLHLDDGSTVSVKQEPMEEIEMTISEHEVSAASGCEDSEHEDESTMASMEHSISVARSLFELRRKEFKNAVKDFEALQQHPAVIMCSSLPTEVASISQSGPGNTCAVAKVTPSPEVANATSPERREAQTQTPHQQQWVGRGSGSASDITEPASSHPPVLTRLSAPSATVAVADGLEHFGLFVAQRLRLTDATTQAQLMSTILKLVLETRPV